VVGVDSGDGTVTTFSTGGMSVVWTLTLLNWGFFLEKKTQKTTLISQALK
jgi:hypothetical protein